MGISRGYVSYFIARMVKKIELQFDRRPVVTESQTFSGEYILVDVFWTGADCTTGIDIHNADVHQSDVDGPHLAVSAFEFVDRRINVNRQTDGNSQPANEA